MKSILKEKNPNWRGGVSYLVCRYCGANFRGERKALYCSYDCYIKAIRDCFKFEKKVCQSCGEVMKVREHEIPSVHNKRKFCSLACAYGHRAIDKKIRYSKICICCGKEYFVHKYKLHTTKYCSVDCKSKYMLGRKATNLEALRKGAAKRKKKYKDYIKGKDYQVRVHSSTYREIAGLTEKSVCSLDGSTKRLLVHHIDGNRANNKPTNLQILCYICHKKVHGGDKIGSKSNG